MIGIETVGLFILQNLDKFRKVWHRDTFEVSKFAKFSKHFACNHYFRHYYLLNNLLDCLYGKI